MSKELKMIRFIARIIFMSLGVPLAVCLVFGLWAETILFFLVAVYINWSLSKNREK